VKEQLLTWQQAFTHLAYDVEESFDALKYRLAERLDMGRPLMIVPYRGIGSLERLYLRGRVLQDKGIAPASDNDSVWRNLLNTYRRLESDEVPGARVRARCAGTEQVVVADEEGFFEVDIRPKQSLAQDGLWQTVDLELLEPKPKSGGAVRATGEILVPLPAARFVVISDIDDTVVHTDATSLLRMARNVFLGNARTRLPFQGVAAFYRALFYGAGGHELNPLFYVSSSPWNLYDLLSEFFRLHEIPVGPVLFLRDWGLTREELLPLHHREHKLASIRRILDLYPALPFILIGDSGQEDPEIYERIVEEHPHRIMAVYIRSVSRDPRRPEAIRTLAAKVVAAGSTLILAENTLPMAEHAAAQGWIASTALAGIGAEKEADAAPPSPLEILLGQGEKAEGPTVVVEGETPADTHAAIDQGAVEQGLQAGDEQKQKPPTVVVKGDEDM
jgi:phosphatidate phosphatase APP1